MGIVPVTHSHKKLGVVGGSQFYERGPSIPQVWTLIVTTFALSGPDQEFDEVSTRI